ncbi:hypothetical protein ACROYT_G042395 [Oculina patagonica]
METEETRRKKCGHSEQTPISYPGPFQNENSSREGPGDEGLQNENSSREGPGDEGLQNENSSREGPGDEVEQSRPALIVGRRARQRWPTGTDRVSPVSEEAEEGWRRKKKEQALRTKMWSRIKPSLDHIEKNHMFEGKGRKSVFFAKNKREISAFIHETITNPDQVRLDRDRKDREVYKKWFRTAVGIHGFSRAECHTVKVVYDLRKQKVITAHVCSAAAADLEVVPIEYFVELVGLREMLVNQAKEGQGRTWRCLFEHSDCTVG